MGCGVSKEDIAEPSRIQSVVVRDGSDTKSLDVASQNAVNTTPVTQEPTGTVTTTPRTSPVSVAPKLPSPIPTPAPVAAVQVPAPAPAAAAAPASPDHCVANGTLLLPFPFPTSNGDSCTPCAKSSEETSSGVAKSRVSNGLVGTLASLEEILNAQETSAQKSKLKVTADKIVSYGGVLRSLESTVELQGAEEHHHGHTEPEEKEAPSAQSVLSPARSKGDDPGSPANLPSFEVARKKLPPLATPPSFMIDKGTDPFVKAPLPTQLLKSLSAQNTHDIPVSSIDLTTHLSAPSSAHSTSTETVIIEHVKDITVVNGTPGFDSEKCSSPQEWTSLEDLHSEDAELENIILLETLEAGDPNDGDFGSRVNHINHNIRVTSLTSELGVSSNGQHSPYSSSCSQQS
ncbi:hypothetical protein Mapa_011733 [Marchantia paleacea]|nr:hypothetical protein Mapa_011733 [Marchantia paleacea]